MSVSDPCSPTIVHAGAGSGIPAPPPWATELVNARSTAIAQNDVGRTMSVSRSRRMTLLSVCVRAAEALDAQRLRGATTDAYLAIAEQLASGAHRHPVRFWNYIPSIHSRFSDGCNHYMAFNAGRFDAFTQWYGGPGVFPRQLPTASGVGWHGSNLVVHCLAAAAPGLSIENPRQVPSYRYSARFGPMPPCFARATVLPGAIKREAMLLVGGTASVRGEDSVHLDDFSQQLRETLVNLASLVRTACSRQHGTAPPDDADALRMFEELRIYYTNEAQIDELATTVYASFGGLRRLELMQADLCRSELLVEIEGMARL